MFVTLSGLIAHLPISIIFSPKPLQNNMTIFCCRCPLYIYIKYFSRI